MATAQRPEYCPACDGDTSHLVKVDLKRFTEFDNGRRPVRVATCQECGNVKNERVG